MYLPSNFGGQRRCGDVGLSGDVSHPYSYMDTLEIVILKSHKKKQRRRRNGDRDKETQNKIKFGLDLLCPTIGCCTFCENNAKLYFDAKHLEKGLNRGW